MRRQAAFSGHDGGRTFPRPGEIRAAADGQRYALLPGIARDRPVYRRASGHPRLSSRACLPSSPRLLERAGPGLERPDRRPPGTSRRCSPCWSRATTTTNRSPMRSRGFLDGHVALDRRIAEGGRYPAVDVLRSLSRAVPGVTAGGERPGAPCPDDPAWYADMADMVRLGAYRAGSDPAVDEAVTPAPRIEAMLRQERSEQTSIRGQLRTVLRAALGRHDAATPWNCCCVCAASRLDEARRGPRRLPRVESLAAHAAGGDREAPSFTRRTWQPIWRPGDAVVEAFAAWLRPPPEAARSACGGGPGRGLDGAGARPSAAARCRGTGGGRDAGKARRSEAGGGRAPGPSGRSTRRRQRRGEPDASVRGSRSLSLAAILCQPSVIVCAQGQFWT